MRSLPFLAMILTLADPMIGCSSDTKSSPGADGATGGAQSETGGAAANTGGMTSSTGGAGTGGESDAGGNDIVETAVAAGGFTKLAAALTSAGLVDALKGKGPFTVFAPNDAAFATFESENPGVLAGLTKDQLTEILKYHVVAGAAVESSSLKNDEVFTTLSGSPVLIDTTSGVKVDDAKVVTADVMAKNGVIHVIDHILIPPKDDLVATAVAAGTFTKLADALTSAGLVSALQAPGPFTVFAPTDTAFAKLTSVPTGNALKDVLLYHVVSGAVGSGDLKAGPVPTLLTGKSVTVSLSGGVKVNDATVTTANVLAKNGVIHVVDTVLIPN